MFGRGHVSRGMLAVALAHLAELGSRSIGFDYSFVSRRGSKTRRTGFTYPHSSTRQAARYGRQIAAGQLRMGGVDV